jgi:hypothetical protein
MLVSVRHWSKYETERRSQRHAPRRSSSAALYSSHCTPNSPSSAARWRTVGLNRYRNDRQRPTTPTVKHPYDTKLTHYRALRPQRYGADVDFYRQVLLELTAALGAALFVANTLALVRRRGDARRAARESAARSRPASPVRKQVRVATTGTLPQAPLARTIAFMLLGLVVTIWCVATLVA